MFFCMNDAIKYQWEFDQIIFQEIIKNYFHKFLQQYWISQEGTCITLQIIKRFSNALIVYIKSKRTVQNQLKFKNEISTYTCTTQNTEIQL